MYADDFSLYAVINSHNDRIAFQNELNELCVWASMWGLKINFDKCKVLHFGRHNFNFEYKLEGHTVLQSNCEKIIGIYVDTNLSFSEHIYDCVKRASKVSNLILSNFYQCNNSVLLQLFKCYVRPILEYGSIIFSPHYVYLVELIEHLQHNFTKRLHGLNDVSYVNKLHICTLESLELCKIHNDLIFVFKNS